MADEIKKIVIDGNKRITDDTIIVFSGIGVGSQVNNDDLNDIVKKLYETNFFKDIKINFKQGILNLKVSFQVGFNVCTLKLVLNKVFVCKFPQCKFFSKVFYFYYVFTHF